MDDPYRFGQQTGTCPRCQNETASDGELDRLVCLRGCGEWYSKARFQSAWAELAKQPGGVGVDGQRAQATDWPWGAMLCPICQKAMSVGFRDNVRFDFCTAHGVWLDAGEFERFAQVFRIS